MDSRASRQSPQTAVVWSVLSAELDREPRRVLQVLDVGGGTGGFAVPLAERGHHVTVVDASPDALAALRRRAADRGVGERITATQADADDLASVCAPGSVDLVLCHAVLEVVDEAPAVAAGLAAVLRPGGVASVLVAGWAGSVYSRALAGQLADAARLAAAGPAAASAPGGGRRFAVADAVALLEGAGLRVEQTHGVRVVADLLPAVVAESDPAALRDLELTLAGLSPFLETAAQLHLLARRP